MRIKAGVSSWRALAVLARAFDMASRKQPAALLTQAVYAAAGLALQKQRASILEELYFSYQTHWGMRPESILKFLRNEKLALH